jgi:hypothetical protein
VSQTIHQQELELVPQQIHKRHQKAMLKCNPHPGSRNKHRHAGNELSSEAERRNQTRRSRNQTERTPTSGPVTCCIIGIEPSNTRASTRLNKREQGASDGIIADWANSTAGCEHATMFLS